MSGTYGSDLKFLKKYSDVVSLSDSSGKAAVAVVPKWQGRVLTSSATGAAGLSFGWINYDFVKSGKLQEHINVFGGEDRFWMGPEGGQFSIFFKKGATFDLDHWYTPPAIDTEAFDVVRKSANSILMKKQTRLANYAGTVMNIKIDREVRILESPEAATRLPIQSAKDVSMVAYESINKISNAGRNSWNKRSGMLSIWILGMFNPSPRTTIVLPYVPGSVKTLGPIVNDAYFGKVPSDRLVIGKKAVFFSGDGNYRSKIGLTPQRAKPVLGSYDEANKALTIVQYTKPSKATDYVNSMWEIQKQPFKGDVVNSYNDGAPKPGAKPLGPFYELETSSPAAELGPGESMVHVNRTFHIVGPEKSLDGIATTVLGVGLKEIKGALKS